MNYYNENDPKMAAWLRELLRAGLIPAGVVDTRSIKDVRIDDLAGFAGCHFFAGIGGWPLALRLAGWPDDRPVWTGSCPCQPFSCAGQRHGAKDTRHLWPWFRHLVFRGRPAVAFGEQVASADGRLWLAGVRSNLETLGYEVGAADLCAAGVGAPHIRQRLYWVADAAGDGWRQGNGVARFTGRFAARGSSAYGRMADAGRQSARRGDQRPSKGSRSPGQRPPSQFGGSSNSSGMADTDGRKSGNGRIQPGGEHGQQPKDGGTLWLGNAASDDERRHTLPGEDRQGQPAGGSGGAGGLANPARGGLGIDGSASRSAGHLDECEQIGRLADAPSERGAQHEREPRGRTAPGPSDAPERGGPARRLEHAALPEGARLKPQREQLPRQATDWDHFDVLPCADGKARRVESGTFPLAHGVPGRVGLLRGYGNAIVPQVAAQFILAWLETKDDL